MSEIDYTEIERPIEPYSESENPEQWCQILAWEEARADKAEAELKRLTEIARGDCNYCDNMQNDKCYNCRYNIPGHGDDDNWELKEGES